LGSNIVTQIAPYSSITVVPTR